MNNLRSVFTAFLFMLPLFSVNMADGRSVDSTQTPQHDIIVVEDIRDFAKKHPGVELVRMSKDQHRARSSLSVIYKLGGHVAGDHLVAEKFDAFAYPAAKDVVVEIKYPDSSSEASAVITFVQIECQQDIDNGNAFVAAGGIGRRSISIVLEAKQTTTFTYRAQFYGLN